MTTDNPLISIIVPVYNTSEYLPRCLDSILRQTYTKLDIILINDGSTDNSGNICNKYADTDSRIKVIHQENAGVSTARNTGLDNVKGEWIGFVDSDDWIEPDMFEKLLQAALESGKDIVVCGHVPYQSNGRVINKSCAEISGVLERNEALKYLISGRYFEGSLCNKIFRSNLILRHVLRLDNDIHFSEDLLFCIRLFVLVDSIYYIPDLLYHYCLNENGAMHTFKQKRLTELVACQRIIAIMQNISNDLVLDAKLRYTYVAIGMFHMHSQDKHSKNSKIRKFLRKEARRYSVTYFFARRVSVKEKMKSFVKFLLPKFGRTVWLVIKK